MLHTSSTAGTRRYPNPHSAVGGNSATARRKERRDHKKFLEKRKAEEGTAEEGEVSDTGASMSSTASRKAARRFGTLALHGPPGSSSWGGAGSRSPSEDLR